MRQQSIQELLAKRAAGTLTPSESDELATLTHRDEVMAAAEQKAGKIVARRRRTAIFACAMTAVVAGGLALVNRPTVPDTVATVQPSADAIATEPEAVEQNIPTTSLPQTMVASAKPAVKRQSVKASTKEPAQKVETVVTCNSQCDADSVISEIWKFLSV